jgi:arylsulfatase A-like enzyme
MTTNHFSEHSHSSQTETREHLIVIVCIALQTLPFLFTRYRELTFAKYYYPHYQETLSLLLFCIPLLTILEVCFILLLIESTKDKLCEAKSWAAKICSRILLAFVTILVIVYHWVIAASWYYYTQTGFFVGRDTLRLFPMLLDYRYVVNTFAPQKLWQILGLLTAGFAFGCWVAYFAPRRTFLGFLVHHGRAMFLCALIVIAIILPQSNLHPVFYGIYRVNSFFSLSPQSSLLWAYVRYGSIEPELPAVSLKLMPRRDAPSSEQSHVGGKNVFLFVVEALRADAIDSKMTPTLHRLALEGIDFSNSYAQSTETSESMLSIITGRYPLKSRLRTRTLVGDDVLRVYDGIGRSGYATGFFGEEWSEDSNLTNSRFLNYRFNPIRADLSKVDPIDNPFMYHGRGLGDYSLAVADRLKITMLKNFVKDNVKAHKGLFAIFYFMSSHFPYDQTDGVPALALPNELSGDYSFLTYPKALAPVMRNRYQNTVAYIDSLLASFVLFLEQQNQLANSIIIITGDHGESFGEHDRVAHSRHLDEEAVRVPLIIWGAKSHVPRWEPMAPVGHVDIAPTIYYLLGLPTEPSFQGERLLSRAAEKNPETVTERPLFLSIQALMHEDAIIRWPWKLVRNLWGEGLRLFRLDEDPHEFKNLFDSQDRRALQLCSCLVGFRASQFNYYDPLTGLESKYYPPRYDKCSDIIPEKLALMKICGLQ